MPAHYFLGSRLLGTSPMLPKWSDEAIPEACSYNLMCPTCGNVWGKVAVVGAPRWHAVSSGCSVHPWNGQPVGATFIAPWRKTYSELPSEVLLYEVTIRLHLIQEPV